MFFSSLVSICVIGYFFFQIAKHHDRLEMGTSRIAAVTLCIMSSLLIGSLLGAAFDRGEGQTAAAVGLGGSHESTVTVTSNGYNPNHIRIKRGDQAVLHFKTNSDAGCSRQVVSDELELNQILKIGDNVVSFKHAKPGTYSYSCGMGMYKGTITITSE